MSNTETGPIKFSDSNIRLVKESDAEAIAELYRLNYGDEYAFHEVYDGKWVKQCIYNDGIMCLVLEDRGRVVGAGALVFEYGGHNDQVGELARLVVHPQFSGQGEGCRIIRGLFEAAQNNVEFAVGEVRTAHPYAQKMVEREGFSVIGFIPNYHVVCNRGESQVIYGQLYGNGTALRSGTAPRVIPEIEPIASKVLGEFGFGDGLEVVGECPLYTSGGRYQIGPLDRRSLERLSRIEEGRLVEPLIFGPVSLGQGYSTVRRKRAIYLVAFEGGRPVGAVGYLHDQVSNIVKGIELIGKDEDLRGFLCECLVGEGDRLGARLVEVNVSAYDPRLQGTLYRHGFRPVAYAPAMAFRGTERLDVVKMIMLNVPHVTGDVALTEKARQMYELVANQFTWRDREGSDGAQAGTQNQDPHEPTTRVGDPHISLIQESDSDAIAELFRINYGPDFYSGDVYDGTWVKKCVYNTEMVGLVNRDGDEITSAVSIQFDYGNQFDQTGKISRFVVHPVKKSPGLEQRMLRAIFEVAENNVEYVEGDTLCDRPHVQNELEVAGFAPVGYLPNYWHVGTQRRSLVRYAKPHGNGLMLRSSRTPALIPEVADLANFVLGEVGLPPKIMVVEKCGSYQRGQHYRFLPLDRMSLTRLSWVREGRIVEPQMFGSISIEQGYPLINRRSAVYMMAVDEDDVPVGAIGYRHDSTTNIVDGIEMIGKEPELRGRLVMQLLEAAEDLRARVVEADISAYDPRLQRTFIDLGFRPVLYAPAMVFRGTERLDVVKMLKLNSRYEESDLLLTEKARSVVSIVERGYR